MNDWVDFSWLEGSLPEYGRVVEVRFEDGTHQIFSYGPHYTFLGEEWRQGAKIAAWRYVTPDEHSTEPQPKASNGSAKKFDDGKPPLQLIPWRAARQAWQELLTAPPTLNRVAIYLGEYLEGHDEGGLRIATCMLLRCMSPDPSSSLLPWSALEEVADVLAHGAKKYDAHNWRKGGTLTQSRTIGAALRHIAAYERDERLDPETGLSHLAHAACELLFALTFALEGRGDDRHKHESTYTWEDLTITLGGLAL